MKKKKITTLKALGAFAALGATIAQADMITVHNMLNQPIYAAVYGSSKLRGINRRTAVVQIPANGSTRMDRTSASLTSRRYLVVSAGQNVLQDKTSSLDSSNLASIGIGRVHGGREETDFYVINDGGMLAITAGYGLLNTAESTQASEARSQQPPIPADWNPTNFSHPEYEKWLKIYKERGGNYSELLR